MSKQEKRQATITISKYKRIYCSLRVGENPFKYLWDREGMVVTGGLKSRVRTSK